MKEDPILVQAERELGRRSLADFTRLAWRHFESAPLVWGEHLRVLSEFCEDLLRCKIQRGVSNLPPGTGKSNVTGVTFPAFAWIDNPRLMFMYVSFDRDQLAKKSAMLIDLVRSDWYETRWGRKIAPGQISEIKFDTLQGGGRYNTTIDGKGTGNHCDIQIGDDLIKPLKAQNPTGVELAATWRQWQGTFASRHRDLPTFRRMINMQRLAEEDPSCMAKAAGWEVLRLPMRFEADNADPRDWRTVDGELLFPEKFPEEILDKMIADGDILEEDWDTQYQQRPTRKGGTIFLESWIETHACSISDLGSFVGRDLQSWDLTFKGKESSDFVAGQYWGEKEINGKSHYFMRASLFRRMTFTDTWDAICDAEGSEIDHEGQDPDRQRGDPWPSIECLIEDAANGPGIEDVMRKKFPGWIKLIKPEGSKTARAQAVAKFVRAGRVHIVRDAVLHRGSSPKVDGYKELKTILSRFPVVRRDDPVDAFSQVIRHYTKHEEMFEALRSK